LVAENKALNNLKNTVFNLKLFIIVLTINRPIKNVGLIIFIIVYYFILFKYKSIFIHHYK